jgi:hypothetical protein
MMRHNRTTFLAVGLAAGLLMATTAVADTARDMLRGDACFARTYDRTHLRQHPRQTVRSFYLHAAGPEWRSTETRGRFGLEFGLRLVGRADAYTGVGMCISRNGNVECQVEGDGGAFVVSPFGRLLRVDIARLELEGAHDFTPDLARADNRIMLLGRAGPGACR